MFDQKSQAEAMILDDLGSGNTVSTDMLGVDRDHHKYILEVRPAGEAPFRIETKANPKIIRENKKQQKASREQALLSGAPVSAGTGVVHHVGREFTAPAALPASSVRLTPGPGA